jgi:hypothetical protein
LLPILLTDTNAQKWSFLKDFAMEFSRAFTMEIIVALTLLLESSIYNMDFVKKWMATPQKARLAMTNSNSLRISQKV